MCYENVAYFNFETNPRLNETFDENICPDYLIPILSHMAGQTIVRERTLIVFDEVQLCERALTALKYFCEDAPDYHIIVAGSLLGVAVNRAKFSFPVGKVDMKTLYQMDMEEDDIHLFLAAGSEQNLKPDLVMRAFVEFMEEDIDSVPFHYHRIDVYARKTKEMEISGASCIEAATGRGNCKFISLGELR